MKKKEQIHSSSLIPVYPIHPLIVHVDIKLQQSRPHSSYEKCDKKFLIFKNWSKRKMKK